MDRLREKRKIGIRSDEYRKVEAQETTITRLKAADTKQEAIIARLQKQFQATDAQRQKEIESSSHRAGSANPESERVACDRQS
jgi:hypothetical protein